jgi:hypothetical protein
VRNSNYSVYPSGVFTVHRAIAKLIALKLQTKTQKPQIKRRVADSMTTSLDNDFGRRIPARLSNHTTTEAVYTGETHALQSGIYTSVLFYQISIR